MRTLLIVACALAMGSAGALGAQQPDAPRPDSLPPAGAAPGDTTARARTRDRARLEQQLQQRFAQVVRRRLDLTDDQFRQLAAVNQRYGGERRALVQQERGLRLQLRGELLQSAQADQQHVSTLLDGLERVQQQRLDLFKREQHDLSAFLTPVQRAKYAGLEEQIRQRINALRRQQLERQRGARGSRRP